LIAILTQPCHVFSRSHHRQNRPRHRRSFTRIIRRFARKNNVLFNGSVTNLKLLNTARLSTLLGSGQCRKQQSHQDANDCNYDEQFNKGKGGLPVSDPPDLAF
jgi:hypothetical protein